MYTHLSPQHTPELRAGVDGTTTFRKRTMIFSVDFPDTDGVVATLEGNVRHAAGDAIVTGIHSERWPINRTVFARKYDPLPPTLMGQPGKYKSRAVIVLAKQLAAKIAIFAPANKGVFAGHVGDWLVQYAPGDIAIVEQEIFSKTYEPVTDAAPMN